MARAKLRIRYRKDRSLWEVDYRDAGSVRRRPLFLTEEEAHEHAREVLHGVPQALPANIDRQISLREYAERWLADIVTEKEAHTVRNYTERLTGHVLPALGRVQVRELHRGHIKTFLAEKRRQGSRRTAFGSSGPRSRPCSPMPSTTGSSSRTRPSSSAAKDEPRRPAHAGGSAAEDPADDVGAAGAFLEAVAAAPCYNALFATLAKAGLRPGEAFALKPGGLDLGARTTARGASVEAWRAETTKTGAASGVWT